MRPLHRPMFRYGGPIKEGVMSGIREPRANGGRAALVGNSVYPRTGGREHHNIYKTIFGWGSKGANVGKAGGAGQGIITQKVAPLWNKFKNIFKKPPAKGKDLIPYDPNKLPPSPFTNQWYWQKGIKPAGGAIKWGAGKALPYATTGGLISAGGLYYANGRWFNKKGEVVPPPRSTGGNTVGPQHPSNNPDLYGGLKTAEDAAKAKLAAEKLRKDKIQKYRDIVDIKGMNKEAAAKSLIEASRLINESQDFKGDIRSGKLINRIIQGTSKAYDKPADMRRAIDTLILKGEIQKDLNEEENALANEVKRKQIEIYDKQLAGKTLNERISEFRTKNQKNPSGNSLEGILLDIDIPVVDVADTTQVDAHIKNVKGGDEVSFMESIVEANVKEGRSVTPGVYVVKDKIIIIDENGKVKKKR